MSGGSHHSSDDQYVANLFGKSKKDDKISSSDEDEEVPGHSDLGPGDVQKDQQKMNQFMSYEHANDPE